MLLYYYYLLCVRVRTVSIIGLINAREQLQNNYHIYDKQYFLCMHRTKVETPVLTTVNNSDNNDFEHTTTREPGMLRFRGHSCALRHLSGFFDASTRRSWQRASLNAAPSAGNKATSRDRYHTQNNTQYTTSQKYSFLHIRQDVSFSNFVGYRASPAGLLTRLTWPKGCERFFLLHGFVVITVTPYVSFCSQLERQSVMAVQKYKNQALQSIQYNTKNQASNSTVDHCWRSMHGSSTSTTVSLRLFNPL